MSSTGRIELCIDLPPPLLPLPSLDQLRETPVLEEEETVANHLNKTQTLRLSLRRVQGPAPKPDLPEENHPGRNAALGLVRILREMPAQTPTQPWTPQNGFRTPERPHTVQNANQSARGPLLRPSTTEPGDCTRHLAHRAPTRVEPRVVDPRECPERRPDLSDLRRDWCGRAYFLREENTRPELRIEVDFPAEVHNPRRTRVVQRRQRERPQVQRTQKTANALTHSELAQKPHHPLHLRGRVRPGRELAKTPVEDANAARAEREEERRLVWGPSARDRVNETCGG